MDNQTSEPNNILAAAKEHQPTKLSMHVYSKTGKKLNEGDNVSFTGKLQFTGVKDAINKGSALCLIISDNGEAICAPSRAIMNNMTLPPGRANAIKAIIGERDYQDAKHGYHEHTPGEWTLILQKLVKDASNAYIMHGSDCAMEEIRQIAATALAAMEQCGAIPRKPSPERVQQVAQEVAKELGGMGQGQQAGTFGQISPDSKMPSEEIPAPLLRLSEQVDQIARLRNDVELLRLRLELDGLRKRQNPNEGNKATGKTLGMMSP